MRTFIILISAILLFNLSSCAARVTKRPAKVTVIKTAPQNHKIVVIKGKHYYFWNGRHYRKTRRGFVFVRV
ncbi:hypothetical protein N1F78_06475 [Seonamhaeicola sp. MEBiC1930]|uniref:hypothetical protein n=1 Tax=Seonamhaeicola sp. MEBiC01930 TaxID=2976768 RepID=UPI00324A60DA